MEVVETKTVAVQRRPRKTKYDWENARLAYVEGMVGEDGGPEFVTMQVVAERMGIPQVRLRERAGAERWVEMRKQHQIRMAAQRRVNRIASQQKELEGFDDNALRVAKLGVAMVSARLAEIARAHQERETARQKALERLGQGLHIELEDLSPQASAVDARELDTLGRAALSFQEVGRRALGVDVNRVELTGQDGTPIQVEERVLRVDEPDRIAAFANAMVRAGVLGAAMTEIRLEDPDADLREDDLAVKVPPNLNGHS